MKKNKTKQIYLQRIRCNCVAQKHQLINNCLSCGKVVCAQQGQGPCLYCGNIVTRPDGKYLTDESLFPELPKQQLNKISQERSKAVIHKNILLERDKSTNMTQNIFDQSVDYYEVSQNQWLDQESRQNAIDKLLDKNKFVESEKFKQKIVFDELTKKFVPQEFSFDEQSFRKEGKQFMAQKEKQQYTKKMQKAKQSWDSRLFNNDKIKQIVTELRAQIPKSSKEVKLPSIETKNKLTQLVLEDQETTNVEAQKK